MRVTLGNQPLIICSKSNELTLHFNTHALASYVTRQLGTFLTVTSADSIHSSPGDVQMTIEVVHPERKNVVFVEAVLLRFTLKTVSISVGA